MGVPLKTRDGELTKRRTDAAVLRLVEHPRFVEGRKAALRHAGEDARHIVTALGEVGAEQQRIDHLDIGRRQVGGEVKLHIQLVSYRLGREDLRAAFTAAENYALVEGRQPYDFRAARTAQSLSRQDENIFFVWMQTASRTFLASLTASAANFSAIAIPLSTD